MNTKCSKFCPAVLNDLYLADDETSGRKTFHKVGYLRQNDTASQPRRLRL